MARRSMKGGFGEGAGFQMALILLALGAIVAFIALVPSKKEKFVPTVPSAEGDKKAVTPSGNVILY